MREITLRAVKMRVTPGIAIAVAAMAAGTLALAASGAQAQSTTTDYPFCLFTGPAQVCAYRSMAQCMASRRGAVDFCMPNNRYGGRYQ